MRVVLRGTRSNRSGIGAQVEALIAGERLLRHVRSGSSYLSQSELPLTLGLGQAREIEKLTIRWPSGLVSVLHNIAADQMVLIDEGKGLVRRQPIRTP